MVRGFPNILEIVQNRRVGETTRRVDSNIPDFSYKQKELDELHRCTRRDESTWTVDLNVDFR